MRSDLTGAALVFLLRTCHPKIRIAPSPKCINLHLHSSYMCICYLSQFGCAIVLCAVAHESIRSSLGTHSAERAVGCFHWDASPPPPPPVEHVYFLRFSFSQLKIKMVRCFHLSKKVMFSICSAAEVCSSEANQNVAFRMTLNFRTGFNCCE